MKQVVINEKECFVSSTLIHSERCQPNYIVSSIMDNLFSTYNLYTPKSYISYVNDCGFEIVSSSKLDPFGQDICHGAHHTVILICKRVKDIAIDDISIDILSPEQSIDQLDCGIYSKDLDGDILETIKAYNGLKDVLSGGGVPRTFKMLIAFKVLEFIKAYIKDNDQFGNPHRYMQEVFVNARSLILGEYSSYPEVAPVV